MRSRGWLAVVPAMVLPVMLLTASCGKKVVQSQVQTQPVSAIGTEVRAAEVRAAEARKAEVPKAEVPKAPNGSADKAGQAVRPEEDRSGKEASAREVAKWVFFNEHVRFAFASSLLSDEARQILNGKAMYLRTNPGVTVTVEGHCDERGTNDYNVALGERRAESVKTFLVGLGIGADRLNTKSYGKERPVAAGHDEDSWARNRRAQFVVN